MVVSPAQMVICPSIWPMICGLFWIISTRRGGELRLREADVAAIKTLQDALNDDQRRRPGQSKQRQDNGWWVLLALVINTGLIAGLPFLLPYPLHASLIAWNFVTMLRPLIFHAAVVACIRRCGADQRTGWRGRPDGAGGGADPAASGSRRNSGYAFWRWLVCCWCTRS
ncbi:hypothetical protein F8A10_15055 [Paracoccus kondratievae]|uniref:hypothetical protein n=1 Tax=Paracoccus kondratievae TaxID=135740 RepID=UPI00126625B2|nr:hypothetical protein [Paracoccus kondratievae]QFQ88768.1 hypothetical protein F8A10_15055 [Paracoccus kondratievae]